ncbi:hypothetical protein MKZ38_010415 [Zalerion maritima]|uniref:Uncharacterized protein n=1 Tax=Zalerion maritima TaxID=339359 RepID=A0AAD5RFH0_9PEZI|nr:hypothetical protein MKZ38_010415 [Zalerion maritima]
MSPTLSPPKNDGDSDTDHYPLISPIARGYDNSGEDSDEEREGWDYPTSEGSDDDDDDDDDEGSDEEGGDDNEGSDDSDHEVVDGRRYSPGAFHATFNPLYDYGGEEGEEEVEEEAAQQHEEGRDEDEEEEEGTGSAPALGEGSLARAMSRKHAAQSARGGEDSDEDEE